MINWKSLIKPRSTLSPESSYRCASATASWGWWWRGRSAWLRGGLKRSCLSLLAIIIIIIAVVETAIITVVIIIISLSYSSSCRIARSCIIAIVSVNPAASKTSNWCRRNIDVSTGVWSSQRIHIITPKIKAPWLNSVSNCVSRLWRIVNRRIIIITIIRRVKAIVRRIESVKQSSSVII